MKKRSGYQSIRDTHTKALTDAVPSPTPVAAALAVVLDEQRPSLSIGWGRFGYWCLGLVFFIILGSGSVAYAMGYRYNGLRGTIEQTSVVRLSGYLSGLGASTYLNGELVATRLPVRLTAVFPGSYELRVEKPGYQTWQQSIKLVPNQRYSFTGLFLLYQEPRQIASAVPGTVEPVQSSERSDISIRSSNELWLDDEFLTRTSQDIIEPRWFAGRRDHIAYQSGATVYLYDVPNQTTQPIITFPDATPRTIRFEESGRILVVQRSDQRSVDRFELFEPNTLFNLLVADS
jgi:hypothetical protein